ncbi:receptor-like protein 12 [Cucumis sativus]|uniref:receptor-like protein 12 n=1 Tax=Cucumis sativus TaxID=3659 RepID=UPI0012F511F9|nr:receptor-like protein 12 [Cucumis sativus]
MNQLVDNITNLRELGLAETNLSCILPTSTFLNFSLSLESLDFFSSELSGNFPDHIFCLPNLRVLKLRWNTELNGHLPMSNWSKSLQILDLSFTNFSGEIPNSIGEAKALRYLDFSYCMFYGEIPNFESHSNPMIMGQLVPNCVLNLTQTPSSSTSFSSPLHHGNICSTGLSNLIYVDLTLNSFTGAIPSWLYSLPNLKYLDLSRNQFFGFMRDFRFNSLKHLDLSDNNLQGEISESIYRQLNLTYLRLNSNHLSGVLNFNMLSRVPNLSWLYISKNTQLSIFSTTLTPAHLLDIGIDSIKLEKIPYFLRNQKYLSNLNLSNNQIVEKVPEWFSELGGLVKLDLSHNFLSLGIEVLLALPNLRSLFLDFNLFNKLPVPMLLSSFMEDFIVSNNKVSGNIHPSICQATKLTFLDLSNNSLSGELPPCLSNMTNLSHLILKSNNLSGVITIPPKIQYYIASENQLIGEIPLSICLSLDLAILSLSNNHMNGTIPPCLTNISTSLSVLNLKNNNFSGSIPTFPSTGCQLSSVDLKNNQIEGEFPKSLLNCEYLEVLDIGNNNMTGYFPYWLKTASSLLLLIL